jgi:hypothetical protein
MICLCHSLFCIAHCTEPLLSWGPFVAQSHELLQECAESITLEEVNAMAASYLSYISHYRAEEEILEQAARGEGTFAPIGPVRATAIVACLPAFTDPSGHSSGAHHAFLQS